MASLATTNLIFLPKNPNLPLKNPHLSSLPSSSSSWLGFSSNPSSSISLSSTTPTKNKQLGFLHNPPRSSFNGGYFSNNDSEMPPEPVSYPKPNEIPWSKELANSVHLIGNVGAAVQLKHLKSGKVVGWTRLGVKKSATETLWINLTFWDELAHTAFQHVDLGHQIYVAGRLFSDVVEGEDGKQQTFYKVVVRHLNFVQKGFTSDTNFRKVNYAGKSGASTQELWQAFFANPVDWWDNRSTKTNPKYPDFKHKDTGEALWVEASYNPPWVKSQLSILDSRMESLRGNNQNSKPISFVSANDMVSEEDFVSDNDLTPF